MPARFFRYRFLQALAFPGLFKAMTLLGVFSYVLGWFVPNISAVLCFDRGLILQGQVWRIITFLFIPDRFGPFTALSAVLLFFAVNLAFMISDAMEEQWGALRTSLYLYSSWLLLLVAGFLTQSMPSAGLYCYTSMFLAFATCYPRFQMLVFFVIPLQVRFLAMFTGLMLLWQATASWSMLLFTLLAMGNYMVSFLPWLWNQQRRLRRRQRFESQLRRPGRRDRAQASVSFHRCAVCQRTELDDSHLAFRIAENGEEYCEEHLPQKP